MDNKKIKDHYNKTIKDRYKDTYEFNRWFRHVRTREDFAMTHDALSFHLNDTSFSTCLEIGPGPGTWTTLLYRKNPEATFRLFDISEEMKKQFELEMRSLPNVTYEVQDFCASSITDMYDIVCSFRMLEYIDDKKLFVKKIYQSLNKGGTGIIITKNPAYRVYRRETKKKQSERFQHLGKITHSELSKMLVEEGFNDIKIYPVVIRLPLIDRFNTGFSRKFFTRWYKEEITPRRDYFTESYLIKFKKA